MNFTIFGADCRGKAANTSYPRQLAIESREDLQAAVRQDHVCAAYRGNYRTEANFLWSDVVPMDVDNQETEDERQWVTPEGLQALLPDCRLAIVPSRNHGKAKHGGKPRPRFHVFFPISRMEDVEAYKALKVALQAGILSLTRPRWAGRAFSSVPRRSLSSGRRASGGLMRC